MKTLSKITVIAVLAVLLSSCVTEAPRVAGELPDNWWTMEVDRLENNYRDSAEGVETQVKLFMSTSDEPTNFTESDALDDATMKVTVEISRYMAQIVTSITQSVKFNDFIKQKVEDSSLKDGESDKVITEVRKEVNTFTASVTTTQFSTMKIIGKHTEKVKGEDFYKGWVCVSMTDDILDQTQKLQEEAFKTLLDLNPEYKQLIADINTEITRSIKDNITDKTDL